MARHTIAGILKSAVLGAALVAGSAFAAQAQVLAPGENPISPFAGGAGNQLELSATTSLTTDYVFRGVSQTNQKPAIQGSLDAAYGIFYAGVWGSNVDFATNNSIELDWYGGIAPTLFGLDWDFGAIWYTYPGANSIDYVEIKTGASYGFTDNFTAGVTNYWSPDLKSNALEAGAEYTFGQLFNFFDPSVSALVGYWWFDDSSIEDYTFWNVGVTLGFLGNWAADVRYWDSELSDTSCTGFIGNQNACDSRVVGTLSASF